MYIEARMIFIMPLIAALISWKGGRWILILIVVLILVPSESKFLNAVIAYLSGCLLRWGMTKDLKLHIIPRNDKVIQSIIFISVLIFLNINNFLGTTPNNYTIALQSFGSVILLYYLIYHANMLGSWINNNLLVSIGGFSYELYLVHFPILMVLRSFSLPLFLYIIVGLLMTMICSYGLHRALIRIGL